MNPSCQTIELSQVPTKKKTPAAPTPKLRNAYDRSFATTRDRIAGVARDHGWHPKGRLPIDRFGVIFEKDRGK